MDKELLKKHGVVLDSARKYYVENQPTGMTDEEYNKLEEDARRDGIDPRTIVLSSIRGERAQNADYLSQVPKEQVTGSMYEKLLEVFEEGDVLLPKYDGSSLAVYFESGECTEIITAGGENRGGLGVVQTEKFKKWIPKVDPRIKCIQCEFLVDLKHGFGDKSRMKANGLMNSKDMQDEVDRYGTLRAFRIFGEFDPKDYWEIFFSIPMSFDDPDPKFPSLEQAVKGVEFTSDVKFAVGACGFSIDKKFESTYESDIYDNKCPTGGYYGTPFRQQLLIDGWVIYGADGNVKKAYKFKDAGRGELSEVKRMLWNNQIGKGKDGWSLNVELDPPVEVRGALIRKPSSGGVPTALKKNITPGAKVTVILANSTIPKVSEVITPGNGDMQYPVCTCGYQMSESDIFGSNLKCGNPNCSERYDRMMKYLATVPDAGNIDFNRLLVIDRLDFNKKLDASDHLDLINNLFLIISSDELGVDHFRKMIESYVNPTGLQKKMIALASEPAYNALRDTYFVA